MSAERTLQSVPGGTTPKPWNLPTDWPQAPWVHGRCPACGLASIFVAEGGYLTCSNLSCSHPDAVTDLLERQ